MFAGGKGIKWRPGANIAPVTAEDRGVEQRWEKGDLKRLGHRKLRKWLVSKGHSFYANVSVAQLVAEAQRMFELGIEMETE